jgi:hypothetical protein
MGGIGRNIKQIKMLRRGAAKQFRYTTILQNNVALQMGLSNTKSHGSLGNSIVKISPRIQLAAHNVAVVADGYQCPRLGFNADAIIGRASRNESPCSFNFGRSNSLACYPVGAPSPQKTSGAGSLFSLVPSPNGCLDF